MGQAFDRDGNVLGEAFGETKREVFNELTKHFKYAAEFRVKSLEADPNLLKPSVQTDRMMQFFAYAHLPAHLQDISKPFGVLAEHIVTTLPSNAERTVALQKLLEAKDCAVRVAGSGHRPQKDEG